MKKLMVMLAGLGLLGVTGVGCAHDTPAEDKQTQTGTGGAGQRPDSMQQETEDDEIFGRSYEDEDATGGAGQPDDTKKQQEKKK